jgi:hypothetical protein
MLSVRKIDHKGIVNHVEMVLLMDKDGIVDIHSHNKLAKTELSAMFGEGSPVGQNRQNRILVCQNPSSSPRISLILTSMNSTN